MRSWRLKPQPCLQSICVLNLIFWLVTWMNFTPLLLMSQIFSANMAQTTIEPKLTQTGFSSTCVDMAWTNLPFPLQSFILNFKVNKTGQVQSFSATAPTGGINGTHSQCFLKSDHAYDVTMVVTMQSTSEKTTLTAIMITAHRFPIAPVSLKVIARSRTTLTLALPELEFYEGPYTSREVRIISKAVGSGSKENDPTGVPFIKPGSRLTRDTDNVIDVKQDEPLNRYDDAFDILLRDKYEEKTSGRNDSQIESEADKEILMRVKNVSPMDQDQGVVEEGQGDFKVKASQKGPEHTIEKKRHKRQVPPCQGDGERPGTLLWIDRVGDERDITVGVKPNDPLKPETEYEVVLYSVSNLVGQIKYSCLSIKATTAKYTRTPSHWILLNILFFLLFIIVLILAIYVLIRLWCFKKRKEKPREIRTPSPHITLSAAPYTLPPLLSVMPIEPVEPEGRWNPTYDLRDKRFLVAKRKNLPGNAYEKAIALSTQPPDNRQPISLREEFHSLPDSRRDWSRNNPLSEEYIWNRFPHIPFLEETRVVLYSDVSSCNTYINANFITGYLPNNDNSLSQQDQGDSLNPAVTYIAAASPFDIPSSLDFWRMIQQQGVRTVVTLTNVVEDGVVKCAQFWPCCGQTVHTLGHLLIQTVEERSFEHYTVRKIKYRTSDEIGCREVTQFHFTSWPAKGAPDSPVPWLEFRQKIRGHHGVSRAPLLVHCGTGLSRTACFIGLDIAIDEYEVEGEVSVFDIVSRMREERPLMVRRVEQYKFIYTALEEDFEAGDTTVSLKTGVCRKRAELNEVNPRTGRTWLYDQFDILNYFTEQDILPEHITTLRTLDGRVTNPYGKYPQDYLHPDINALQKYAKINPVLVDGFRQKRAFALVNTSICFEFWQFLEDYDVVAVINLGGCKETEKGLNGHSFCKASSNFNNRKGRRCKRNSYDEADLIFKADLDCLTEYDGIFIRDIKLEKTETVCSVEIKSEKRIRQFSVPFASLLSFSGESSSKMNIVEGENEESEVEEEEEVLGFGDGSNVVVVGSKDNLIGDDKKRNQDSKVKLNEDDLDKKQNSRVNFKEADKSKSQFSKVDLIEDDKKQDSKVNFKETDKSKSQFSKVDLIEDDKKQDSKVNFKEADKSKSQFSKVDLIGDDKKRNQNSKDNLKEADKSKSQGSNVDKEADKSKSQDSKVNLKEADKSKSQFSKVDLIEDDKKQDSKVNFKEADKSKSQFSKVDLIGDDKKRNQDSKDNLKEADKSKSQGSNVDKEADKSKSQDSKINLKEADKSKSQFSKVNLKEADKSKSQDSKINLKEDDKKKNQDSKVNLKEDDKKKNQDSKINLKEDDKKKNQDSKVNLKEDDKKKNQDNKGDTNQSKSENIEDTSVNPGNENNNSDDKIFIRWGHSSSSNRKQKSKVHLNKKIVNNSFHRSMMKNWQSLSGSKSETQLDLNHNLVNTTFEDSVAHPCRPACIKSETSVALEHEISNQTFADSVFVSEYRRKSSGRKFEMKVDAGYDLSNTSFGKFEAAKDSKRCGRIPERKVNVGHELCNSSFESFESRSNLQLNYRSRHQSKPASSTDTILNGDSCNELSCRTASVNAKGPKRESFQFLPRPNSYCRRGWYRKGLPVRLGVCLKSGKQSFKRLKKNAFCRFITYRRRLSYIPKHICVHSAQHGTHSTFRPRSNCWSTRRKHRKSSQKQRAPTISEFLLPCPKVWDCCPVTDYVQLIRTVSDSLVPTLPTASASSCSSVKEPQLSLSLSAIDSKETGGTLRSHCFDTERPVGCRGHDYRELGEYISEYETPLIREVNNIAISHSNDKNLNCVWEDEDAVCTEQGEVSTESEGDINESVQLSPTPSLDPMTAGKVLELLEIALDWQTKPLRNWYLCQPNSCPPPKVGPLVIQAPEGSNAASLVCACALVCERVQEEQTVDVYHLVKDLRRKLPYSVDTFVRLSSVFLSVRRAKCNGKDQYELIWDALCTYATDYQDNVQFSDRWRYRELKDKVILLPAIEKNANDICSSPRRSQIES